MAQVYIAAGSNVEPETYLARALCALESHFAPLTVSPAYRNPAAGFSGADFINLVVAFRTELPLGQIRQCLQDIEALCDRLPDAPKWAPRSMDLDMLLYGDLVSDQAGLVLPRPDLVRRPYMLKPMADIAPGLRHPTLQRSMLELWQAFDAGAHPMCEVTIPRCAPHPPPESGR